MLDRVQRVRLMFDTADPPVRGLQGMSAIGGIRVVLVELNVVQERYQRRGFESSGAMSTSCGPEARLGDGLDHVSSRSGQVLSPVLVGAGRSAQTPAPSSEIPARIQSARCMLVMNGAS